MCSCGCLFHEGIERGWLHYCSAAYYNPTLLPSAHTHSHQRRRPHSEEGEFVRKSFITEDWIKKEDSPENWETWLSEALWGAREYFPTGISRWDIIIIIIVFVVILTKTLGFPSGNCKEHVMTKMQRPTNFNLFLSVSHVLYLAEYHSYTHVLIIDSLYW